MNVPHSKPLLDEHETAVAVDIIQRGEISIGPEIEKFERKVAQYIGKKYAVACSNGTSALHLALLSLNLKEGDEVILPASVCPGVMHAVEYTNATPVLCDTNSYDLNPSYESVCQKLSSNTKAIILPHLFGIPADLNCFKSLNIPIIEDCAQSLGAKYKGSMTGSLTELSVFSFYATKMMTSIDGGMVLTDHKNLADQMRDLRYYAGKKDYKKRYNYKMQNINAAIGLVQLDKLNGFLTERKNIFDFLAGALTELPGLKIFTTNEAENISSNFKLLLNFTDTRVKNIYLDLCAQFGISTGNAIFIDLHQFKYGNKDPEIVNLHNHLKSTYAFPIYPGIDMPILKGFIGDFKKQVHSL